METVTLEVGERPQIEIQSVGGDLRLVGREGTQLEAQASSRGELSAVREGDRVVIAAQSGCLIFLPAGAQVAVETVGGDARLSGLTGSLRLGSVAGDLRLRRVHEVSVGRVAGDLVVHKAAGTLAAEWVGGDALVEQAEAALRLGALGGDLLLGGQAREVQVSAGGDVQATFAPAPGTTSRLQAGGDLACRLPPSASASVRLHAGGDIALRVAAPAEATPEGMVVRLGNAEAAVELTAAGDLRLQAGAGAGAAARSWDWREGIEDRVRAQVDAAMTEMQSHLETSAAWRSDRIAERVRRSMERARGRSAHRWQRGPSEPPGPGAGSDASTQSGGDQERLAILRMLEQGKITVEQAEKLFQALEGKA